MSSRAVWEADGGRSPCVQVSGVLSILSGSLCFGQSAPSLNPQEFSLPLVRWRWLRPPCFPRLLPLPEPTHPGPSSQVVSSVESSLAAAPGGMAELNASSVSLLPQYTCTPDSSVHLHIAISCGMYVRAPCPARA